MRRRAAADGDADEEAWDEAVAESGREDGEQEEQEQRQHGAAGGQGHVELGVKRTVGLVVNGRGLRRRTVVLGLDCLGGVVALVLEVVQTRSRAAADSQHRDKHKMRGPAVKHEGKLSLLGMDNQ